MKKFIVNESENGLDATGPAYGMISHLKESFEGSYGDLVINVHSSPSITFGSVEGTNRWRVQSIDQRTIVFSSNAAVMPIKLSNLKDCSITIYATEDIGFKVFSDELEVYFFVKE